MRGSTLLVVFLQALFGASAAVGQVRPVTDEMLRNPDPGDWLMTRRTYDAQSYSPLDQIHRGNVDELRLVWSWGIEKELPRVDDQVGPIVHDGIMPVFVFGLPEN